MNEIPKKLSPVSISLHWIVGISMISMLAMGIYMKESEVFSIYDLHKSIGILLLIIAFTRFVWRLKHKLPRPVGEHSTTEKIVAKTIHWVLIIGTLLIPISGLMMSGAGGWGVELFGLELIKINPDPVNPDDVIPYSKVLSSAGSVIHEIASYAIITCILVHILGAIKHHFIDKDRTLSRMLGR